MGEPQMWSSSAGILTKSLKKQTLKRPFWFCLAHTNRVCSVLWSCPSSDSNHSENRTEKLITEKSTMYSPPFIPHTWCSINYSCMLKKCITCTINPVSKPGEAGWAQEHKTSSSDYTSSYLMQIFVRPKLCRIALMLQSGLSEISR